jgi:hemerythrin
VKSDSHPHLRHDVRELEQRHDKLFQLIDQALAQPLDQLGPQFRDVVASIDEDFRHEEQLMDTFECADSSLHREQHARMQAGLHHAAAALDQGDPVPAVRALGALRKWLVFHVTTQDRHLQRQLRRDKLDNQPRD